MDKSLMLDPADYVGVSFWIISAAMVAATYFFYVERDRAVGKLEDLINSSCNGYWYCSHSLLLYA